MFFHPSMHTQIARLRHRELLQGVEHRLLEAALAGRQKDRGRWLSKPQAKQGSSPTATTRPPRGAEA